MPDEHLKEINNLVLILELMAGWCGLLASGSTTVVLSKFELSNMLGAIEKYKVNYLPLVPPILVALTKTDISSKYDLGSLHVVLCGGVP